MEKQKEKIAVERLLVGRVVERVKMWMESLKNWARRALV